MRMRTWLAGATVAACAAMAAWGAAPTVSNVRASQRAGTKLVDIWYDCADADGDRLSIAVAVEADGAPVTATSLSGDIGGAGVLPGGNKKIVWDAGADWAGQFSSSVRVQVTATDVPSGMALIPAGSFTMGDSFTEGSTSERPTHSVTVSAFFMDRYEVTKAKWDEVRDWGLNNGYTDLPAGGGVAANHPVQTVSWHAVAKWCNARSQKDGLTPCYTVGGATYKTGSSAPDCNWSASGYRLPTEAEWEKAARGYYQRIYPWGNEAPDCLHVNYDVNGGSSGVGCSAVEVGRGTWVVGFLVSRAGDSPFGLKDMAGNVSEWVRDYYGDTFYRTCPGVCKDPLNTDSVSGYRVIRGGGFLDVDAEHMRVVYRDRREWWNRSIDLGFRCRRTP